MDERSIDEFESLFESAIRPNVEIEPVEWTRILVSLDGSDRADVATAVALHLAQRVRVPVRFLSTLGMRQGEDEEARKKAAEQEAKKKAAPDTRKKAEEETREKVQQEEERKKVREEMKRWPPRKPGPRADAGVRSSPLHLSHADGGAALFWVPRARSAVGLEAGTVTFLMGGDTSRDDESITLQGGRNHWDNCDRDCIEQIDLTATVAAAG